MLLKFALFYFAALWASFFMVVGQRSVKEENFLTGRSHCDYCQKTIPWPYLLPMIGYLLSRGNCQHCGHKVSIIYPLGELTFGLGVLIISSYSIFPSRDLFVFSLLFIMAAADLVDHWVPDYLQVILLVGLFSLCLFKGLSFNYLTTGLALFAFFLLNHCFKNGLGGADIKTMLILLLCYPLTFTLVILQLACLLALIVLLYLNFWRRSTVRGLAFFPFLYWAFPLTFIFFNQLF